METPAGEPDGPVTVAPVNDDDTELNFRPNGEPATSSATEIDVEGVVAGGVITKRPRPVVPSACARSAITCFKPAWVPVPFMMVSTDATAGVLIALPENMKLLPAWVLRIPTIDDSSVCAFCCAMVCPVLLRACGVVAASLCTCPVMLVSD